MKTVCCSNKCERQLECAKHAINNSGINYCEDFYSFGSGTISSEGCTIRHWCGELGNWKMFESIITEESMRKTLQELEDGIKEMTAKFNELAEPNTRTTDYEDNEYDDFFGVLTREEYEEEMKEHHKRIENMAKINDEKAEYLLNKFKENLFAVEFVSDEEAEMLYYTILNWQNKAIEFNRLYEEENE